MSETNYINNSELLKELVSWKNSEKEQMTNDIARAIIQICNNLARSGRFAGYTWKEDMVADAIVACVQAVRNFDHEKSNNPFAYFTQIAYNAFRRRINIEHHRLATIERYKNNMEIMYDVNDVSGDGDDYGFIDNTVKLYDKDVEKTYIKEKKKRTYDKEIEELFQ